MGWPDILSSGWLCSLQVDSLQTSHTLNTSRLHRGLSLFSEFMGQWELGSRDGRECPFKTMEWKNKNTPKVTVLARCVFHGLTSSWSNLFPHEMSRNKVRLSPQNCQKLLFSVSELWRVLVRMTQVIVRSLSDKISSVLLPFPCKNSRIWM